MVSSILTNNGAMTALQSLKATQKNLLDTQNRISTGLKVGTAKDNAATWAVATSMRSDIANFKQVSENLSVSSGVVKTASTGTEQIASLISKIREQVTSVQDGVKDAATVQATIKEYVGQIEGIIGSSSYKGVNLINNSQSGDTQILASVNADGDSLNPAYISVAAQNLTMESGGQLAALSRLTVERAESNYSYAPVTGTVDAGDKVSFTFKVNGVERVASYAAVSGDTAANVMTKLKDEINARAGSGNAFADIDVDGNLVVNAGLATDVVTFDGETALKKAVDANSSLTLGAATDLAPPAPKFSYGLGSAAPVAGQVYSFDFEVDGQEKTAEYTVLTGDNASDVLKGLKDAINYAAGTGNEIANIDSKTGKLVVDAAGGASKVEFTGETALKLNTNPAGATATLTASSSNKATYTAASLAAINNAADVLQFSFTLNGETKTASATGVTAAADAMAALVTDINDKAGARIAYVDGTDLIVDSSVAGSSVSFDRATAVSIVDGNGSVLNTAPADATSTTRQTFDTKAMTGFQSGDVLSFSWNDGAAHGPVTATGTTLDEAMTNLVSAINTAVASTASFDDGKLIIDHAGLVFGSSTLSSDHTLTGTAPTTSDEFDPAAITGFSADDGLAFDFMKDGVSMKATATGSTALQAMTNLADDINTKFGREVAVISGGKMIIDGDVKGFSYTASTALLGVVNTADGAVASNKSYSLPASDSTRMDKLSFVVKNTSGTDQTVTLSRTAGQSQQDFLEAFATQINAATGDAYDIAFVNKDGDLVVDAYRAADTDVAFTASSALTTTSASTTGVSTEETPASSTDYSDLLATLKTVENTVLAAGAAFGAAQTRIDLQKDFMDKLVDTLTSGVGALVDADMSEEAARLQALQVQEQLGTQALSIANQAPQSILSLFRG